MPAGSEGWRIVIANAVEGPAGACRADRVCCVLVVVGAAGTRPDLVRVLRDAVRRGALHPVRAPPPADGPDVPPPAANATGASHLPPPVATASIHAAPRPPIFAGPHRPTRFQTRNAPLLWTRPISSPSPPPLKDTDIPPRILATLLTSNLPPTSGFARTERKKRVPRTLKHLTTIEEPASCNFCHNPTATLLLHGPASAFASPHAMSLTCHARDAAAALDRSTPSESTTKRKIPPVGVERPLVYSACMEEVGVGVMRMLDVDSDGVARSEGRAEPGVSLEPRASFRLPTRPPRGLPASLVTSLIAFCEEASYKRFAEAKYMEIARLRRRSRGCELGASRNPKVRERLCAPLKPGTRRYACVTSVVPTVKTQRAAVDPLQEPSPSPATQPVQFHLAKWLIEDSLVSFAHGLGSINVAAVHLACHRDLLNYILADAVASSLPAPQHAMQLYRPSAAEIDKDDMDLPHPENSLG
ncbi:hypothetical protein BDK51DRAFT_49822 [Blyttiomyces helicus]|uniref:Uncharacterized protein n=1 Tax=Blyttiomyces helicus TaxID=388810 RepID=A0A4P9VVE4_9FUNG|nr:hypothetical protein BDK51DRAFT_49822 [Blyttiomyces helicus]|eukprot:RKO83611.1 hypothetical protein BDK51DRAFT_49822 [Blyttiomyces helicus]